jgi:hypothetical protein
VRQGGVGDRSATHGIVSLGQGQELLGAEAGPGRGQEHRRPASDRGTERGMRRGRRERRRGPLGIGVARARDQRRIRYTL